MNSNNPISFFEDLILENQLSIYRNNFFKEAQEELSNIEIDKNKDLVYYYDVNNNGETIKVTISFKRHLKSLLHKEFKKSIKNIDSLNLIYKSNEFDALQKSLISKINYIEKKSKSLEYFEVFFSPLLELRNRIKDGYFVDNFDSELNLISDINLRIKEPFKRSFFDELYIIATEFYLFNEYEVLEVDFFEIITSSVCAKQLKFTVENQITVAFFESLKPIFIEFNAKLLENTKRFITKGGSIITQSSYNRNKNLSSKNKTLAIDLTKSINELIVKYS